MLRLAKHYGIKTGQRGGQRFARYPSGACLLQFSLEGERHYLHLGTAGERVLLSHEWTERDETRRIKSRYDVSPIPHELLLLELGGTWYFIADIGLRMLIPRELYRANGFPDDYIIDRDYTGREYPKSKQIARCGNAVPPPFAEALVRANLPEWCGREQ